MLSRSVSKCLILMVLSSFLMLNKLSLTQALVAANGQCLTGNRGDYALYVDPEDGGRLEIEFEVETNSQLRGPSRNWKATIEYNGIEVYNDILLSRGYDGEVAATAVVTNVGGSGETIKARIENMATGDVCEITAASPF